MHQLYRRSLYIGLFAVIFAGGCAKEGVVKKDEMVPQAAPAGTPAAAPAPAAKATGIKDQSLKETTPVGQAAKDAAAGTSDASLQTGLEKIFFAFDAFTLSSAARDTLQKDAAVAKGETASIRIEGHCDERGSDEYNLALGEKRAKEAMKYLVTMGVPAERLSVISYGKEKPADPGHNESAWAKNRRDEFVVVSK